MRLELLATYRTNLSFLFTLIISACFQMFISSSTGAFLATIFFYTFSLELFTADRTNPTFQRIDITTSSFSPSLMSFTSAFFTTILLLPVCLELLATYRTNLSFLFTLIISACFQMFISSSTGAFFTTILLLPVCLELFATYRTNPSYIPHLIAFSPAISLYAKSKALRHILTSACSLFSSYGNTPIIFNTDIIAQEAVSCNVFAENLRSYRLSILSIQKPNF